MHTKRLRYGRRCRTIISTGYSLQDTHISECFMDVSIIVPTVSSEKNATGKTDAATRPGPRGSVFRHASPRRAMARIFAQRALNSGELIQFDDDNVE